MPTMIQIRNVPEKVHRQVKARAALAGMTMSDYILRGLIRTLERPTRAEVLARLARLPAIEVDSPPAEVLRQSRELR